MVACSQDMQLKRKPYLFDMVDTGSVLDDLMDNASFGNKHIYPQAFCKSPCRRWKENTQEELEQCIPACRGCAHVELRPPAAACCNEKQHAALHCCLVAVPASNAACQISF